METYGEAGPGDYAMATKWAGWIKEAEPKIRTHFWTTGISQDEDFKKNALAHDIIGPGGFSCTDSKLAYLKSLGKTIWMSINSGKLMWYFFQ